MRMPGLSMPFLGVLGLEYEEMGWGTKPEDVAAVPAARRAVRARSRAPATSSTSSSPSVVADLVLELVAT